MQYILEFWPLHHHSCAKLKAVLNDGFPFFKGFSASRLIDKL